jgi:hypothetical protein
VQPLTPRLTREPGPRTPSKHFSSSSTGETRESTPAEEEADGKVILSPARCNGHARALHGEVVAAAVGAVAYCVHGTWRSGQLMLTNYRLIITPDSVLHPDSGPREQLPMLCLPLGCVAEAWMDDYVAPTYGTSATPSLVHVTSKGFRGIQAELRGVSGAYASTLCSLIRSLSHPGNVCESFAFAYGNRSIAAPEDPEVEGCAEELMPVLEDGWNVLDVDAEFTRLGLLGSGRPWRLYNNSDFISAPSYPPCFLVPASFSDGAVQAACRYRSRGRPVVVVWRDTQSGGLLARSSQPLSGLTGLTCPEDEAMLDLCRAKGGEGVGRLLILDARSPTAALGNQLTGKGVEVPSVKFEMRYANICNISGVQESWAALGEALSEALGLGLGEDEPPSALDYVLGGANAGRTEETELRGDLGPGSGQDWLAQLASSQWLHHVRKILRTSVAAATALSSGLSVLIRCSDGWDRTPQLCATAQLLLDPLSRTMRGFAILIQHQWCDFGHKFEERCGSSPDPAGGPGKLSPIFVQWLDVVWQIVCQFPSCFEFGEELLAFLGEHCYARLYGTFLCNSAAERAAADVPQRTTSVWTDVLSPQGYVRFRNQSYSPLRRPIWPCTAAHKIHLFERLYCQWHAPSHPALRPWVELSQL